jgi:hypothetical protein
MTSPTVRDNLAMHRLGVMRKRSAQAQHKKNCPECSGEGGGGLPALLRILGAIEPEQIATNDDAPKH